MDIFIPLDVLSSRKAERVHPVSCQGCLQETAALNWHHGVSLRGGLSSPTTAELGNYRLVSSSL